MLWNLQGGGGKKEMRKTALMDNGSHLRMMEMISSIKRYPLSNEIEVMVTQHQERAKCHRIVHCEMVNFMMHFNCISISIGYFF